MTQVTLPVFSTPSVSPDAEPFWLATAEDRLLIKRCTSCGDVYFYPRPICPFCGSTETRWEQACGHATLYSFTIMRKWEVPAAIAFVELEEGPRILSLVVGADLNTLHIGQSLTATYALTEDGRKIILFKPIDN